MISYGSVGSVLDVIGTFGGRESLEENADTLPCCFGGSFGGVLQQMFEFGEEPLDRVEVGTVVMSAGRRGACAPHPFRRVPRRRSPNRRHCP